MNTIARLNETVAFIRSKYAAIPQVAVVLGSGLGNFTAGMQIEFELPYKDIPHFPVSTVAGHSGKLIFGKMGGKNVVCMAGRFHYYEGYVMDEVVFPIRVMGRLGAHSILISNAAGGMNPAFKVGDLMIINDHISMFMPNALIGKNEEELGPRFPDMSEPYCKEYIRKAKDIAAELGYKVFEGVYAAVTGPTFETPAEYRMLSVIGADTVGMSTVPECIVANHMGMKVFGMSVVTDLGITDQAVKITHEEVLHAAKEAEPKLTAIFAKLIKEI
jgi:purine-nucleoside phosphorylase